MTISFIVKNLIIVLVTDAFIIKLDVRPTTQVSRFEEELVVFRGPLT